MGQNPTCPGCNEGNNQRDNFKYIFEVYSFHHHHWCWPILAYDVLCTEDVGLPIKSRINVRPASQPIAGSMPVYDTAPTLILYWVDIWWLYRVFWLLHCYAGYGARKHDTSAQCCCNAEPPPPPQGQHYTNENPLSSNHYNKSKMIFFWTLFKDKST